MSKKQISALIIVFMGLVSFFLILNSNKKEGNKDLITNLESIKNSNPYLNFEARPQSTFFPSPVQISNNELAQETNNLTERVAQNYFQEFIKRNNQDSQIFNDNSLLTLPTENVLENILRDNLNQYLQFTTFTTKDLRLTYDNSTAKQLAYLNNLETITKLNFAYLKKNVFTALEDFFEQDNPQTLQQIISIIPGHINDLLKLQVPSYWKTFHLQTVTLWQKKLIIYQALINFRQDPIQAMIAFQEFPQIIEEVQNLQITLEEKFQDLNYHD